MADFDLYSNRVNREKKQTTWVFSNLKINKTTYKNKTNNDFNLFLSYLLINILFP